MKPEVALRSLLLIFIPENEAHTSAYYTGGRLDRESRAVLESCLRAM